MPHGMQKRHPSLLGCVRVSAAITSTAKSAGTRCRYLALPKHNRRASQTVITADSPSRVSAGVAARRSQWGGAVPRCAWSSLSTKTVTSRQPGNTRVPVSVAWSTLCATADARRQRQGRTTASPGSRLGISPRRLASVIYAGLVRLPARRTSGHPCRIVALVIRHHSRAAVCG
jgi:hypothetical protein